MRVEADAGDDPGFAMQRNTAPHRGVKQWLQVKPMLRGKSRRKRKPKRGGTQGRLLHEGGVWG